MGNFYPRPLRGGRQPVEGLGSLLLHISIHALCEEGDGICSELRTRGTDFYPRPLRGGRQKAHGVHAAAARFLSTPSARRATGVFRGSTRPWEYFYPRPLRGGRRGPGGRPDWWRYFYPRPLRGGRHQVKTRGNSLNKISIHALCEEGDVVMVIMSSSQDISIHALCEEGDPFQVSELCCYYHFYPRPLRGGRPSAMPSIATIRAISIHALCEEGDSKNRDKISIFKQIIQHSARI